MASFTIAELEPKIQALPSECRISTLGSATLLNAFHILVESRLASSFNDISDEAEIVLAEFEKVRAC